MIRARILYPPAIVIGGGPQANSVGRQIAALGVPVYGLGTARELRYSRSFRKTYWPEDRRPDIPRAQAWTDWLLGEPGAKLAGAVLLACNDEALTLIAHNREALAERFTLDRADTQVQLDMLDKGITYEIATKAEVPTPRYWTVSGLEEVIDRRDEFSFPLVIKPLRSHEYQAKFPGKFRTARSADELIARFREMGDAGIECMLVEMIEGPDSLLCSYFTYVDETGKPAFHFTKRIIRRNPPMQGNGVYHITAGPTADPEIKDLALKFITAAQIRGLANTEFKRDPRDGALKLIECNVRFVASNVLLAAAGVDLPALVYKHIVGEPVSWPITYRDGLRLWHPVDDLRAFVALRRRGELTFPAYVRSVAHRQTFPIMHWDDPLPAVARAAGRIRRVLSGQPYSPA